MATIDPRKRRLGRRIHHVLLVGVIVSAVLLAAGLALTLLTGTPVGADAPPPFGVLLAGVLHGDSRSLLVAGLLVLMATPLVRVAVLAASWAAMGDRRFAAVATAVLVLLALSLTIGVG